MIRVRGRKAYFVVDIQSNTPLKTLHLYASKTRALTLECYLTCSRHISSKPSIDLASSRRFGATEHEKVSVGNVAIYSAPVGILAFRSSSISYDYKVVRKAAAVEISLQPLTIQHISVRFKLRRK